MKKNTYLLLITTFFIILYRFTSFSKITFGDSLGKILDIENNKFNMETYSITHFLYQNFTVLVYKILPFIDPIEIGRWVNIFCAAIVLAILFKTIEKIFKDQFTAILGTLAFGFSFTFWKNTVNVEVYTFSLMWIISYIYFSVCFFKEQKSKYLFYAGIILGISLFSHIQGILLLPSYVFLCFINYKITTDFKRSIIYIFIPILFLCCLYIYPILNQESIKNVLSSSTQTWVSDTYNKPIYTYLNDIAKAIFYLAYNFWFLNLLVFFLPFKTILNNNILLYLGIICIPVFSFSTIYAVSDNYVFFLNFNVCYIIILCFGIANISNRKSMMNKWLMVLILATPFYYYSTKEIALKTSKGKEFHQENSYKGGLNYYMVPWLNHNKGLIEVYLNNEGEGKDIDWMFQSVEDFIELRSTKMSINEIEKL